MRPTHVTSMNTTDVRQRWADVKELLKPTWWCGALPGVTMAVLYLAHFHEQRPMGLGVDSPAMLSSSASKKNY